MQRLNAAAVREWHQEAVEPVFVDSVLQLSSKELVVQLLVFRQRATVNRICAPQEVARLQVTFLDRLGALI